MYTGALENHPDVIEGILQHRPRLWGNRPEALQLVRSPQRLASWLREHDIPCPRCCFKPPPDTAQCPWLIKPRASAGGRHIAFWNGPTARRPGFFFQEFIAGLPCAAVFLGVKRQARLLGVTEQLVGQDWLQAAPFHYCGSIGPLALSPALHARFERLGMVLATGFNLQGLFGVDCVLRDDTPFPVEVNPRYTASIEVLERACGCAFLSWQRAAFEPGLSPPGSLANPNKKVVGKAILFARQPLTFPREGPWQMAAGKLLEDFADIPPVDQRIEAGQPIMTFFSRGPTAECCREKLQQTAWLLDRWLFGKYK